MLKEKKLKVLAVAFILLTALVPILFLNSFVYAADGGEVTLSAAEIKQSYIVGSEFAVPSGKLSYGGVEKTAETVVHYPDNKAVSAGVVFLDVAGNYRLEYRANFSGSIKSFIKTFSVISKASAVTSSADSAFYAEHPRFQGQNGLRVQLSENESFSYNKVFDISNCTSAESLIEVAVIPKIAGTALEDFNEMFITFYDVYDENNYLTIAATYHHWEPYMTYFRAGATGQRLTGLESASQTIHIENAYGSATSMSTFDGRWDNSENRIKIYFDYSSKRVTVNYGVFVIDLDDPAYFTKLWSGFTTGEVKLGITCNKYSGTNKADFLITKLADCDLSKDTIEDTKSPKIIIESPPESVCAVKGMPFKVMPAKGYDDYSGIITPNVRVFGNYKSSSKYELEVTNEVFVPDLPGLFTIEYTASDRCGNTSVAVSEVYAYSENRITLDISGDRTLTAKAGELIKIAEYSAFGGAGNIAVNTVITLAGQSIPLENGYFRPKKAGVYRVTYTAVDYIGQIETLGYDVTVSAATAPIFLGNPALPKYFIVGSTYTLPDFYADDFTESETAKIKAKIEIADNNGTNVLSGNKYTPSAEGNIIVRYYIEIGGNKIYSPDYTIKTIYVGETGQLDLTKYFYSLGTTISANESNVIISANGNGQKTEFINPLLADGFNINFDIDSVNNEAQTVEMILYDSENSDISVKLGFHKGISSTAYSSISINDGFKYRMYASFYGNSENSFFISYNNISRIFTNFSNISVAALKTISGEDFYGFPSGKICLEIGFTGVSGNVDLLLETINGQPFNNARYDLVKPKITPLGEVGGSYKLNDIIMLNPVIALDVLDPNITFNMTVFDPENNIVIDENGLRLFEIAPENAYKIKLAKYGTYNVTFFASDAAGRLERNYIYVINVIDDIPPVISGTNKIPKTANVGGVISVPELTATDNVSKNIVVAVCIVNPYGFYKTPVNGRYTFTEKGTHKIIYSAYDEIGNVSTVVYEIVVN